MNLRNSSDLLVSHVQKKITLPRSPPPPSRQSFLALEGVERDTQGTRLGNENAENGLIKKLPGVRFPLSKPICDMSE